MSAHESIAEMDEQKLGLIREMMRTFNYARQNKGQQVARTTKNGQIQRIYFLREKLLFHFSFEGFGDLFGYQIIFFVDDDDRIGSALVNTAGDVTLHLQLEHLPKKFTPTIYKCPVE